MQYRHMHFTLNKYRKLLSFDHSAFLFSFIHTRFSYSFRNVTSSVQRPIPLNLRSECCADEESVAAPGVNRSHSASVFRKRRPEGNARGLVRKMLF